MDFELDFDTKRVEVKSDHSPTNKTAAFDDDVSIFAPAISSTCAGLSIIDDSVNCAGLKDPFTVNASRVSTSSDDFEHILKDKSGFNFINSSDSDIIEATFDIPNNQNLSDSDMFRTLNMSEEVTMDYQTSEQLNDSSIAAKSIYDEIENDYLNPYASNKTNEKFISSEDLLGDFKSDPIDKVNVDILAPQKPIESVTTASVPSAKSEMTKNPDPILTRPVDLPPPPPPAKVEEKSIPKVSEPLPVLQSAAAPSPIIISELQTTESEVLKPTSVSTNKPRDQMISAEEIFYKFGLDAWFKPDRLHPKVESLIYWRDVKKSGIVFGAGMAILLAISFFSVISVVAYVSLLALIGTMAFRIYKNILQAVQKTSEGHPFKEYLDFELAIPQEKIQQLVNVSVVHINAFLAELRRLFLVEDLVDSIKFASLLWCLTYVGSWFNGMTLVILGFVALFTIPKIYENNKQSIDTYLDLVRSKVLEITDRVKTAVPIGAKKRDSDKDK